MTVRALIATVLLISPLFAWAEIGQIKSLSGEVWDDDKRSEASELAKAKEDTNGAISATDEADEPHDPEETTTSSPEGMSRV